MAFSVSGQSIKSASLAIMAALSLSACISMKAEDGRDGLPGTVPPPPPAPGAAVLKDWRGVVTPFDRDRYNRRAEAWQVALEEAARLGGSGDYASLGTLVDPAVAMRDPIPAVGSYRCRTIKLGSQGAYDGLGYVVYGWFACRIENSSEGLRLVKETGSQRVQGILYPEDSQHMVLLGTMALGSEARQVPYGIERDRDVISIVERIGSRRWRVVTPWPTAESKLDILELERL